MRAAGHTILDGHRSRPSTPGAMSPSLGPRGRQVEPGRDPPRVASAGQRPRSASTACPSTAERLEQLRRETAWVDPAVQLWNRSLLDNLSLRRTSRPAPCPLARSSRRPTCAACWRGCPTGCRRGSARGAPWYRAAKANGCGSDGPCSGLGCGWSSSMSPSAGSTASSRRELLARARQLWRQATLLCITHDVGETQAFDRVLVVDGGRIVEDGAPADLAAQPSHATARCWRPRGRCGRGSGRVAAGAGSGSRPDAWSRTIGREYSDERSEATVVASCPGWARPWRLSPARVACRRER